MEPDGSRSRRWLPQGAILKIRSRTRRPRPVAPSTPAAREPGRRAGSLSEPERAGFTLVELLLAAAIAALIGVALARIFGGVLDLAETAHSRSEAGREAQLAASMLESDVGRAQRVLQIGSGSLELLGGAGDTIRYSWDSAVSDTLWRSVDAGTAAAVAAGVDSLSFTLQTVTRPFTTEIDQPVTTEEVAVSFSPGDWDEWVAETACYYESRGSRKIKYQSWCAEEFWPAENYVAFSRAAVRVKAVDAIPPDIDLLIRVHEANPTSPRYPGTLLAEGSIDRNSLGSTYNWKEAVLTQVSTNPIVAGGHYWIVIRPKVVGSSLYAGHVEQEKVTGCYGGWPGTDIYYRDTEDAGGSWTLRTDTKDAFFSISGLQTSMRLTEITQTLADTLGVAYGLKIATREEPERRAGFVALHDL
jgi:prepilin-type N-terminal cleavage/methylation domain-containing protein